MRQASRHQLAAPLLLDAAEDDPLRSGPRHPLFSKPRRGGKREEEIVREQEGEAAAAAGADNSDRRRKREVVPTEGGDRIGGLDSDGIGGL